MLLNISNTNIMKNKMSFAEAGKLGAESAKETLAFLKQERIKIYDQCPKLCRFCKKSISYEKRYNYYCNQSCSAKLINIERGHILSENKIFNCLFCLKEFYTKKNSEQKYCSSDCMSSFWWQEKKEKLLKNGYDLSYANRISKKYLIEINNGKCQICNLNSWNGKDMPLVLDHINGNSNDNNLNNLRVLCNNCDALTDTFKAKNKGNGRFKRRKRYEDNKSY